MATERNYTQRRRGDPLSRGVDCGRRRNRALTHYCVGKMDGHGHRI